MKWLLSFALVVRTAGGAPCAWSAAAGVGKLCVNSSSISSYSLEVGGETWLQSAPITVWCNGAKLSIADGSLVALAPMQAVSGKDPRLAFFSGVEQNFSGRSSAPRCAFSTRIVFYQSLSLLEFQLKYETGANGTASTKLPFPSKAITGAGGEASSNWPSFQLPSQKDLGFIEVRGDMLGGGLIASSAGSFPKGYEGGLQSGPLALFDANDDNKAHPAAVAIAPLSQHKDLMLTPDGGVLSAGVSSYIKSLPPGYTTRVALVPRQGINAAYAALGHAVQTLAGTEKLALAADPLNRQISYMTDNGGFYCFCNRYRNNGDRTPMYVTLAQLKAYHSQLGLNVSLYHLDPFWWSQEADGACLGGGTAPSNWSVSKFHFPQGLEGTGLDFQLLYKTLGPQNTYQHEWPMETSESPAGKGSHDTNMVVSVDRNKEFFTSILTPMQERSHLRAIVWEPLQVFFLNFASHLVSAGAQQKWMAGFASIASELGLPIRLDQGLPSDHMASVEFPAMVAGRCGGDMDSGSTWQHMGAMHFMAAVGVRPIMDVLWTNPLQPGNTEHLARRSHTLHELVIAVLTTGPVGFGDALNKTNTSRLALASRNDGTILKPAHPAMRLDEWYVHNANANVAANMDRGRIEEANSPAEVWDAVTAVAAADTDDHYHQHEPAQQGWGRRKRRDGRANSMLRLGALDQPQSGSKWHHVLLATNVQSSADRQLSNVTADTLFPPPDPTEVFVVAEWGVPCANGSLLLPSRGSGGATGGAGCLRVIGPGQALDVSLSGGGDGWGCPMGPPSPHPPAPAVPAAVHGETDRQFRLFNWSPKLPGGYALVGEQSKLVHVSPQRFVAKQTADADAHVADDMRPDELIRADGSLSFAVRGSVGELVPVTVVVPSTGAGAVASSSLVLVVEVRVGSSGESTVVCRPGGCVVSGAMPAPAAELGQHKQLEQQQKQRLLPELVRQQSQATAVGCADSTCDALCNISSAPPIIVGCVAKWPGHQSLRAPKSSQSSEPCGGDRECAVPADACAAGWEICLSNPASSGALDAFRTALTAEQCATAYNGALVTAMNSGTQPPCPDYESKCVLGCQGHEQWGCEPVCCGTACHIPSCPNAVWKGQTRIKFNDKQKDKNMPHSCGQIASSWVQGVLCCKTATQQ